MEYTDEINGFYDLLDKCWSGALSRLYEIDDLGLGDNFMAYLKDCFQDRVPSLTEINDFIWFEVDDWIEEHKEDDDE